MSKNKNNKSNGVRPASVEQTPTERVTALEAQIESIKEQLNGISDFLSKVITMAPQADGDDEKLAVPVGSVGQEYSPEPELGSVDDFLFVSGPEVLVQLSQMNVTAAEQVTDWLIQGDDSAKKFFLLWFASYEEIRKFLLYILVARNLPISQARFELLQSTISKESLDEIRALFEAEKPASQGESVQPMPAVS